MKLCLNQHDTAFSTERFSASIGSATKKMLTNVKPHSKHGCRTLHQAKIPWKRYQLLKFPKLVNFVLLNLLFDMSNQIAEDGDFDFLSLVYDIIKRWHSNSYISLYPFQHISFCCLVLKKSKQIMLKKWKTLKKPVNEFWNCSVNLTTPEKLWVYKMNIE